MSDDSVQPKVLEAIQAELHGIHKQFAILNGTVKEHDAALARHCEEIYGDTERGTAGLKPQIQDLHDIVIGGKAIIAAAGFIGVVNVVALFAVLADHL